MSKKQSYSQQTDVKRLQRLHQVENMICDRLDIPSMRAGSHTIRDRRDWRVNEIQIQHSWLTLVHLAFQRPFWLFSIQFLASPFREFQNPAKLVQGICMLNEKGDVMDFFHTHKPASYIDDIKTLSSPELRFEDMTLALDGVSYEYYIFTYPSDISFKLNNPQGSFWENWSEKVWKLGKELAQQANSEQLNSLFPST